MAARWRARFFVLLPAVGLALAGLVAVAPSASADDMDGPYKPGTTITDTAKGHTVEWRIQMANPCGPFLDEWQIAWVGGSGIDNIDYEESGEGDMDTVVTAIITAEIGATATPGATLSFSGENFDPEGEPCYETVNLDDSFVVTAPVVKTTASLKHKPSLPGFTGDLTAAEGCDAGRKVHLYKVDAGPDTHLDTKTSSSDGFYKFKRRTPRATYYVKVVKDDRTVAAELVCAAAKSSNVKVE